MAGDDLDIEIRGAGPVGCTLALALRGAGLRVALSGRRPAEATPDQSRRAFRPLALSHASRLILERAGAWEGLPCTPIGQIHVSQAGRFGQTRISREDVGLPALGYVVDYAVLASHLAKAAGPSEDPVEKMPRLVVHAEGSGEDAASTKDYGHTAVVALVESDPSAGAVAWERFTPEGPLALLPLAGRYGLVWSRPNAVAADTMGLDDAAFLDSLQSAFGRRAGRFIKTGPRAAMPLALRYRSSPARAGEVHIGNAAQTLHPVAGQGLNLGLRDAWDLAQAIRATSPQALGSLQFAKEFSRLRKLDALAAIRATDLLATLYVRRDPLSPIVRGMALTALDLFPPARRAFAKRMVFGASAW
jgi:2-octaprenyl-6-methoxyphenol hydroxylase